MRRKIRNFDSRQQKEKEFRFSIAMLASEMQSNNYIKVNDIRGTRISIIINFLNLQLIVPAMKPLSESVNRIDSARRHSTGPLVKSF